MDREPLTPEHDKLSAWTEQHGAVLADFIDHLTQVEGIIFCKYATNHEYPCQGEGDWGCECTEDYECDFCANGCGCDDTYLQGVGGDRTYSQWIGNFIGVDYDKLMAEKDALYQVISKAANERNKNG